MRAEIKVLWAVSRKLWSRRSFFETHSTSRAPPSGKPMRTRPLENERGIALAVALFCLVVIGAIVAGNFFAGRLEQQSGRNMFFVAEALEAAEAGVADALTTVTSEVLETLPVGGSPMVLSTTSLGPNVSSNRDISRLTATLFLIRARGVRANVA